MRSFVVFLFAGVLALCGMARGAAAEPDFYFIQLSDPQFGMWSLNKDTVREEETFRKAAEKINRLNPAFVLITGDLVNAAGDPEQIAAFQRSVRLLRPDIPVRLLPGNHDIWGPKLDKGIEAYEKLFGPDHYAFSHGGVRFIVLNSNIVAYAGANPERDQRQRWWFQAQLEAARAARVRHIVVCTHHPWFLEKPDEPDQYFNVPLAQRRWYLDRMRENGVTLALAGHLHKNSTGEDGPLKMITTSAVGQPLGKDPSGFRIIRFRGRDVETPYYGLDDAPARVDGTRGYE